ncbi:MAG TPA: TetR/AcrR family transcriptional regulator [Dermatophilaceae bacterium]|nr:TetR/AcrR family transcriptional regulator [Dermatophilaceae bacterium]
MPRIDAPTVAQHREQRRRQVVRNAAALLRRSGPAAVTPAAVARASGLARTSVYQYFPTSAELVAAAVEESFIAAADRLDLAVRTAGPDPRARLHGYARAVLHAARDGHHPATLELGAELPPPYRARLRELHRQIVGPLVGLLRDWPVADPERTAGLALAVFTELTALVGRGADPEETLMHAVRFVTAALEGLSVGTGQDVPIGAEGGDGRISPEG